jgi:hypothetical protein
LVWRRYAQALDFDVRVARSAPIPAESRVKFDVLVAGCDFALERRARQRARV